MFQPKDADWLNGYKNKTHICTVYKKPTSTKAGVMSLEYGLNSVQYYTDEFIKAQPPFQS